MPTIIFYCNAVPVILVKEVEKGAMPETMFPIVTIFISRRNLVIQVLYESHYSYNIHFFAQSRRNKFYTGYDYEKYVFNIIKGINSM